MVKMLYPISSRVSGDVVTAKFSAEVDGRIRTIFDVFTKEQWDVLCSGQVLKMV